MTSIVGILLSGLAFLFTVEGKTDETAKNLDLTPVFALAENLAKDANLLQEVRNRNTKPLPEFESMTNERWKTLPVRSKEVRLLSKNSISDSFRKLPNYVSEVFISAANGSKVAFLTKPTNWTHLGKPKHDLPMKGQKWTGEVELDDSTGIHQIQVSVPILDQGKPIGSLVIGVSIAKLRQ